MEVVLLLSIIAGISLQSVVRKSYNNRVAAGGVFTFSAVAVFAALIFFICSASYPLSFTSDLIPYALAFAASYCTASVFSFLAIREGSLSLTSLMISFSLLIPTLWGIFFYGDDAGIFFFLGLGLLLVSLVLINFKKGDCKITLKWGIYVLLTFLGNGICSTVQNGYAKVNTSGKSEFMIIALAVVFLVLIGLSIFTERERMLPSVKSGVIFMAICGVANGAVNLFVILLSPLMNTSIMFPLISAGGIVLTSLIAIFFYKEKLSLVQYVGMILGIGSIVFMNLN